MNSPVCVADLTDSGLLDPYFWKGEEQIVLLRHVPGPTAEVAGHFVALLQDLKTHRTEPLEAFNIACRPFLRGGVMHVTSEGEPGHKIAYPPPTCRLSPDGRCLAGDFLLPKVGRTWYTMALEPEAGQEPYIYAPPAGCDPKQVGSVRPVWLSDSRHWIALISRYENEQHQLHYAVVHDIEYPEQERVIALSGLPEASPLGVMPGDEIPLMLYNRRWDLEAQSNGVEEIAMYTLPLNASHVEAEPWTIRFSKPRILEDLLLSPQGDRLAWLFRNEPYRRPDGSRTPSEEVTFSLCVSALNGEQMRTIAIVPGAVEPAPDKPSGKRFHFPWHIAWLPSGNAVSFRYRNNLWLASLN